MNKLLSCRYNMDTNRVEARFEGGTTVAIDCTAIEGEYGNTPAQRAELDWLLYRATLHGLPALCVGMSQSGSSSFCRLKEIDATGNVIRTPLKCHLLSVISVAKAVSILLP